VKLKTKPIFMRELENHPVVTGLKEEAFTCKGNVLSIGEAPSVMPKPTDKPLKVWHGCRDIIKQLEGKSLLWIEVVTEPYGVYYKIHAAFSGGLWLTQAGSIVLRQIPCCKLKMEIPK
jgi:hypothetical protein